MAKKRPEFSFPELEHRGRNAILRSTAEVQAEEALLAQAGDLVHRIVDRGSYEVFGHFRIVREQLAIDGHPAHFVTAAHAHADEAAAGLAGDFHLRDLVLRALHVFLHALRLLHQSRQRALHRSVSASYWGSSGRTLPGTTRAPKVSIID